MGCVLGLGLAGCGGSDAASSSDAGRRVRAVHEAAAARDDEAVDRLAMMAKDEDLRVASEAALALGRLSSDRAVRALREVATAETRAEVRKWAAVGLGQCSEPLAAETLRQVLVSDPSPEVRGEAAMSLGRVGTADDVVLVARVAGAENDSQAARSEVTAMEKLTGVKFAYDPQAPDEARKAALNRICFHAVRLAARQGRPLTPAAVHARD